MKKEINPPLSTSTEVVLRTAGFGDGILLAARLLREGGKECNSPGMHKNLVKIADVFERYLPDMVSEYVETLTAQQEAKGTTWH